MIIIRFPDDAAKRRALGALAGRFSFKSWATGEMMVPAEALSFLAVENGILSKGFILKRDSHCSEGL